MDIDSEGIPINLEHIEALLEEMVARDVLLEVVEDGKTKYTSHPMSQFYLDLWEQEV